MSIREELLLLREYHKRKAFDSFESFLIFMEFDREPEKRFYLPRRKVMKPLVDILQDLEDDKLDIVTISLPPGIGKSTLGIFFLAWIFYKYPDDHNLASGHSSTLTRSINDGFLEITTDSEYNFAELCPNPIITNAKEMTIDNGKQHRFSTLTCRSIDGSLTGATRCNRYLYVDDLVSGIEEALSPDRLEKLWGKYSNDLKSRKKKTCKEIHIATRWSTKDPIGRIQENYKDNKRAKFIVVPALDENGESNFDYEYGCGFDTAYFMDMKDNLDPISYSCLYDQKPMEREGLLFPEEENKYFLSLPKEEPDLIISATDVAFGGGDSTSMPMAYVYGSDVYIADVVFTTAHPDVSQPMCANLINKHKPASSHFEMNNGGDSYADKVNEKITTRTSITKKRTTGNKLTRIVAYSPQIKEFYYLDPSLQSKDYKKFMKEYNAYNENGKVPHDDAPDSLAMLASSLMLRKPNVGRIKRSDLPI